MKIKKSSKGFTLVEMMIVVAIIGTMAAFIAGSVRQASKSSRDKTRTTHMANLRTSLIMYYEKNRDFPTSNDQSPNWPNLTTELSGYINMAEIKDPLGDPNYYYKYEYVPAASAPNNIINCKLYYGSEKQKKNFDATTANPDFMWCR